MIALFRSKSEFIFVASVILVAIFLAKFPTVYNWLNTPDGLVSSKNSSWFDAWDTNFQVSDIRWGMRNGIMAQNTYTTIAHNSAFIYQFYTLLGILNRPFQIDPFIVFHVGSVIGSLILLGVCYFMTGMFIKDSMLKYAAFIIIALGGGLGWLGKIFFTADLTVAGFTMVNALERGSEAISTALLLATFAFLLLWFKSEDKKYFIYVLISSTFSITLHPPFAALYIAVSSCIAFYNWYKNKKAHLFLFPVIHIAIFLLYYLFVSASLLDNPGFAGVIGQELFTLDSLRLAMGFGIMSPLILWALVAMKREDEQLLMLKLFFVIQLFFMFLPFGFHLYYVKGVFVWGVLLSILGLADLLKTTWLVRALVGLVIISILSRVYIFKIMVSPSVDNQFFYIRDDEGAALEHMKQFPSDTSILSLYRIGNFIPASTDNRVYYGHNFQTPSSRQKKSLAMKFYTTMGKDERYAFLTDNRIDYVYYGLEERIVRYNQGIESERPFADDYPPVFADGDVIIYKVASSAGKLQ